MYSNLMSLKQGLKKSLSSQYEHREIENIFYVLMEDGFGLSKIDLMTKDVSLSKEQRELFETYIESLKSGLPVQYVLGKAKFYELEFKVDHSVLIPRPETEELVQWIIQDTADSTYTIWDIGTGSGCIGISLGLNLPAAQVFLSDISPSALKIAEYNVKELGTSNCKLYEHNILDDSILDEFKNVNIIVSNPPYIPQNDKELMHDRVLSHEPQVALFVENEEPLLFYNRILQIAREFNNDVQVYFEIHEDLHSELEAFVQQQSPISYEFRKDLQGKIRMLKVQF